MAEVVVVGASVAGAATAIHLRRLGRSVQLVEQSLEPPRAKACGEGLFSAGVTELAALGLLTDLLPQAARLTAVEFETAGHVVAAPLGRGAHPAIGIQRRVLDSALLALARSSGVEVCTGVRADGLIARGVAYGGIQAGDRELGAQVVVAADGAGSHLRRAAGLDVRARRTRFGVSAHFALSGPAPDRVRVHFQPGYEVYATPVGGALVNVAVLLGRRLARQLGGRLPEAYRELVIQAGALPDGAVLIDGPVTAGPFPARARRSFRSNLVLVGDAAGFFDGVTGEGMSLALISARLGAEAVDRCLKGEGTRAFEVYDHKRRGLARNSTLLGMLTLALASQPRIAARSVANLARRPETFARLVAINTGERPLTSLRPRDLSALLLGL